MPSPEDIVISLENVCFAYPAQPATNIIRINAWQVHQGERVFVAGSSGSGKSTLLRLLCGLETPTNGAITVLGSEMQSLSARQRDRFRATEIGYVAQSFNLIPYLSAIDNLRLALSFASMGEGSLPHEELVTLLAEINLDLALHNTPVANLSIGQQQRVAIARAIVKKPKLLIADEPTSSLDHENRDAFIKLLMKTADLHGMTLVFVSHDLSLQSHFSRVERLTEFNQVEAG